MAGSMAHMDTCTHTPSAIHRNGRALQPWTYRRAPHAHAHASARARSADLGRETTYRHPGVQRKKHLEAPLELEGGLLCTPSAARAIVTSPLPLRAIHRVIDQWTSPPRPA